MDAVTLHHGDALDVLRGMADNSVDAIVTDPPYGLSDHDAGDVAEALGCWLRGEEYHHGRGGFMGRTWDAFVPGPSLWREVYRVLKPGGHLLCFAGTRTQDLMGIAIRLAGFECRDTLQWLYGSGFPKSHDVGKAIDKAAGVEREVVGEYEVTRDISGGSWSDLHGKPNHARTLALTAPATDAARQWDGWGTALKPAHEPILVFRKPLMGTVAANVLAYGTGALHIEACRVAGPPTSHGDPRRAASVYAGQWQTGVEDYQEHPAGRWPPNVALSHSEQCERVGTRRVRGAQNNGGPAGRSRNGTMGDFAGTARAFDYADADGFEAVDDWRCVDGCAVRALAEQSGERKGGTYSAGVARLQRGFRDGQQGISKQYGEANAPDNYGDTGTAARFFPNFEPSPLDTLDAPWLYTAKAGRREREAGLEGMEGKPQGQRYGTVQDARPHTRDGYEYPRQPMRNTHPTVKSLALMRWLCRLVTPPGGVVLDCFLGSGTTGMAATMEGFRFIGVEQDAEYIEIARRRIAWAQEQQPPLLRATGD